MRYSVRQSYELLADRRFYQAPANRGAEHPDAASYGRLVADGWRHTSGEISKYDALQLPKQGSKIHASERLADVEWAVKAVWEYYVPHRSSGPGISP
jgi:class III lanthionine synthetase